MHMSRIGKAPILVKPGVTVSVQSDVITVTGPKGTLSMPLPQGVLIGVGEKEITVSLADGNANHAVHGLVRAQLDNLMTGVDKGWTRTLVLSGVGYRAAVTGANLVLSVGFSHPVTIEPPQGISFSIVEGKVVVSGIDKQLVGQIASNIRRVKPPEPYKGKGIMYEGERIRKKAGKSAKGVGGPGSK